MQQREKQNDIQAELDRKARRSARLRSVLPFTGLVALTVFFTVVTRGMLVGRTNLMNLLIQSFTVSLVGIGAAFVYAHGGMDFSVGASSGLAQFVALLMISHFGLPVWVGVVSSILVGILVASLVGSISIVMRVPVFIASLGVRAVVAGLLMLGTNGIEINIDYSEYASFNSVPLRFAVLLVVIAVGYYLFEKTRLGKYEKAIGGNARTAFQAGVRVNRTMMIAYVILGFTVGLAAFFQLTRTGVVNSNSGSGLEFLVLLALVLGGFPMTGGSMARLRAIVVGAFTITILSNGLVLWGLDVNLVNGVMGLLFLATVAISYDRTNLKQFRLEA